jgi:tetratricopeptide (TPR) repeat protein
MARRCFLKRLEAAEEAGTVDKEAGELLILVHLRRGDYCCLEDTAEGWIEETKKALEYVNKYASEDKERRAEVLLPLALAYKNANQFQLAMDNLNLAKTVLKELIPVTPEKRERYEGILQEVEQMIEQVNGDIEAEKDISHEQVSEEIKKISTESTSFDAPTRSDEPVQIAVKRKPRDETGAAAKRPNTSDSPAPDGSSAP